MTTKVNEAGDGGEREPLFLLAAVTNYCMCGDLRRVFFRVLQVRSLTGPKSRREQSCALSGGSEREAVFSFSRWPTPLLRLLLLTQALLLHFFINKNLRD